MCVMYSGCSTGPLITKLRGQNEEAKRLDLLNFFKRVLRLGDECRTKS